MRKQSDDKVRRSREEWQQIIEGYRSMGLSGAAFWRKHPVSKSFCERWRRKIGRPREVGTLSDHLEIGRNHRVGADLPARPVNVFADRRAAAFDESAPDNVTGEVESASVSFLEADSPMAGRIRPHSRGNLI
jgi:hypothetical protein